jgi:atypical dual specificity phosphatase
MEARTSESRSIVRKQKSLIPHNELHDFYFPKEFNFFSNLLFRGTLAYNKSKTQWAAWSKIRNNFFLGRIPESLYDLPSNVKLVVSVITYGELAAVNFPYETFEARGIRHIHIPMVDFSDKVSIAAVVNAILIMHEYAEQGATIAIHCKAGRARSGMVAADYLAYAEKMTLDEAIASLQEERDQVDISPSKYKKAEEILAALQIATPTHSAEEQDLPYLATLQAKNDIIHLTSFKQLATHLVKSQPKRGKHLQAFLKEIYESTDGKWYDRWDEPGTDLHQFLAGTSSLRPILIANFRQEVMALIAKNTAKQAITSRPKTGM